MCGGAVVIGQGSQAADASMVDVGLLYTEHDCFLAWLVLASFTHSRANATQSTKSVEMNKVRTNQGDRS